MTLRASETISCCLESFGRNGLVRPSLRGPSIVWVPLVFLHTLRLHAQEGDAARRRRGAADVALLGVLELVFLNSYVDETEARLTGARSI